MVQMLRKEDEAGWVIDLVFSIVLMKWRNLLEDPMQERERSCFRLVVGKRYIGAFDYVNKMAVNSLIIDVPVWFISKGWIRDNFTYYGKP